MSASLKTWVAALATVSVAGCAYDATDPHLSSTGDNPLGTFEEFQARTPHEPWPDGRYIVEGDIPVRGDDALYQYWSGHEQGALAVYNTGSDIAWNSTQKVNLTYCIDNSFGANAGMVLDAALGAGLEWQRRANVKFIHVSAQDGAGCINSNNNVVFNIREVSVGNQFAAEAFWPNASRSDREVLINVGTLGNTPRGLVAVLGHEFGHALGFRHEFVRPEDTTSCGTATGSDAENDSDWRGLTPYDAHSIMSWPGCGFDWWSSLDRDGASSLYGPTAHGKDDLFWRTGTSLAIWFFNTDSSVASFQDPQPVDTVWAFGGIGDFNGDRLSDVLWRNTSTGAIAIWLMNGTTVTAFVNPGITPSGSQLLAVADVDGDGIDDVLWHNPTSLQVSVWLMARGGTIGSTANVQRVFNTWSFQGVGDFNNDHRADLLWRNGSNVAIWMMNGAFLPTEVDPTTTVSSDWTFEGTGDFNKDGISDIIWRNSVTTDTAIWWMSGGANVQAFQNYTGPTSNWVSNGAADVTGDGVSDLVWRDTATGDVAIWVMASDGTVWWYSNPGNAATYWTIQGFGTFN